METAISSSSNVSERIGAHSEQGEEDRKRRRRRRTTTELSEDLITEILLRLPVKSLLRFSSVCKPWYDLIKSPSFIAAHYKITSLKKKVSIFLPNDARSYLSSTVSIQIFDVPVKLPIPVELHIPDDDDDSEPQLVGCYNGLICLSLSPDHHNEFLLWNPVTSQSRIITLTLGNFEYAQAQIYSGLCFDSVSNSHKIVRIRFRRLFMNTMTPEGEVKVILHVFTLSDNSWRKKRLLAPFRVPNGGMISLVTYLMRFMCWVVSGRYSGRKDKYILCLDMVDEEFKLIELPCSDHIHCNTELVDYKGSLAMFVFETCPGDSLGGRDFDMWVLNDCGGSYQSWRKQLTLRPPMSDIYFPIGFFTKGGVDFVVLPTFDGFLLWDEDSGETHDLLSRENRVCPFFLYSESLAPVH